MSNWTHVAAVFRVDGWYQLAGETLDYDEVFGKECLWGDDLHAFCEERKKAEKNPEKYLPLGSEGSLHKSVWANPDNTEMACLVVTVWGDLRDHESLDEIENWFRGCCKKLDGCIRQATCLISNELNGDRTISFRFGDEIKPAKPTKKGKKQDD